MRVEMDDLSHRVHAAVGAPGTDGEDGMTGDESYRGLHGVLDRRRVLLRLPTGVLGAVILHDGGDAAAEIRHVNRAGSRLGAGLPVSGWRSLHARLLRGCCGHPPDRPCPCTPAPGRAWCQPRSWSRVPFPAAHD